MSAGIGNDLHRGNGVLELTRRQMAMASLHKPHLVSYMSVRGDRTIPSGICPFVLLGMPYATPTRYVRVSRRLASSTVHVPSSPLESEALR